MAKKSNKTEHVLKLITKDEELLENIKTETNQKEDAKIEETMGKEDVKEVKETEKIEESEEIQKKQKDETNGTDDKQVFLINLTEKIASERVAEVMEKMNVCNCPICTNDVLALALNSLKHNYVTTDMGRQFLQLEIYKKQYETDVLAALTKACVRVKASPKHELK
ncbi:MAG: late competence development ComFB family protein [Anaerovoracaceae bacterium]|jgi:competence protein ComFB